MTSTSSMDRSEALTNYLVKELVLSPVHTVPTSVGSYLPTNDAYLECSTLDVTTRVVVGPQIVRWWREEGGEPSSSYREHVPVRGGPAMAQVITEARVIVTGERKVQAVDMPGIDVMSPRAAADELDE